MKDLDLITKLILILFFLFNSSNSDEITQERFVAFELYMLLEIE